MGKWKVGSEVKTGKNSKLATPPYKKEGNAMCPTQYFTSHH